MKPRLITIDWRMRLVIVGLVLVGYVASQTGTDPEADSYLLDAGINGDMEVAEHRIAGGADVNGKDEDGWTALHAAARNGYKEIAELLIAEEPIYRKPFALYENCNCIATRDNCCQTISKCSIARKNIDASH